MSAIRPAIVPIFDPVASARERLRLAEESHRAAREAAEHARRLIVRLSRDYWRVRVWTYPVCLRAELLAARDGHTFEPTRLAVIAGLFQPAMTDDNGETPRPWMAPLYRLTEQGRFMRCVLLDGL